MSETAPEPGRPPAPSDRWFEALLEAAPDGVVVVDHAGRIVLVNAQAERLFAYSRLELVGEPVERLVPIGVRHAHARARDTYQAAPHARPMGTGLQLLGLRKDGTAVPVDVSLSAFDDGDRRLVVAFVRDVTASRRVEDELAAMTSFRVLAERSIQGLCMHRDGVIFYANDALLNIFGYDADTLLGQRWSRLVVPADRGRVEDAAAAVLSSGASAPARLEFQGIRSDGARISLECALSAVPWPRGPAVVWALVDVTERERSQEALRRAHDEYRQVVESAGAVMWRAAAATLRFTFVSQEARALLGYPLPRWTAEPDFWADHLHPDDRGWVLAFRRHAAETRLSHEMSYRMVSAEHRTVWVQDLVRVVASEDGTAELVGVTIDTTERVHAREAAQASETRYRSLFENAHDIIYVHDLTGRLVSVNRAAERALGYRREELLGMRITELVAPEHREEIDQFLAGGATGSWSTTVLQLELVGRTGRRVPLEVGLRPVVEGGRAVGVQGIARDLSERRDLEAQLREAQRLEGIGRLAGGVAHDFNNLLTVIAGRVEMLRERLSGEPELAQDLEMVQEVAHRASALTRQLLAFSRRQTLQPRVLDLAALVQGLGPMLQQMVGEDIDLVIAGDGRTSVRADAGQIEQVVLNLVVNARDAMPRGGRLTIRVRACELDEPFVRQHPGTQPGPHAVLEVADTGIGMDEATRDRVFEPFFTTKEPGVGTGLGLATVYGIVRQHAGTITVDSAPDRGTTFSIYLPHVSGGDDQPAEPPPRSTTTEAVVSGSETILLVEDQPAVRQMTRELLIRRGYKVLEASGAAEALQIAGQPGAIDLLLTDVVMPHMRGPEVAEHVTRLRPGIAVLYVSGYADDAQAGSGALPPGSVLLQKPFTGAELSRAIRDVLAGRVASPGTGA